MSYGIDIRGEGKVRQLLQRCAVIGVALVLGLVLTEGLLRLLQLAPTNSVVTVTETAP